MWPEQLLDYGVLKKKLKTICDQWDEYTLLPEDSKHLKIKSLKNTYSVIFNNEKIPFLKSDCLLLPIENTTVEGLSSLMLQNYLKSLKSYLKVIRAVDLSISSGPGQVGHAHWVNPIFRIEAS